jgi:hypothetical protein
MTSISLLAKDKRLTKISVRLTFAKACFEGCQIVSWDILTKEGLQEPWSITDGDKLTSCFCHFFSSSFITFYISHNLHSQEIQEVSHVPKLIQVLRGRWAYVKLNSNAVKRSTIPARSWKNTHKIGFCTTWLHGRYLVNVNGSGSLEPLLQYRIQIVGQLPTVFIYKCSTARALFPYFKASRSCEENCRAFCRRDIKMKWERCGPHKNDGGREPKEWKCSELLLEHWWNQKRLQLVLSQEMAKKYLVNHLTIIPQVLDNICLIRSLGALSLRNTKKSTVIVTNIWRCHTDTNSLDSMLCLNLLPSVLLAYCLS